jgi:hypothetical protein
MRFDATQFAGRREHPVSAHITANGWISNGIDFDSYSRMSTQTRKQSGERRLPTPLWAMNNPMLRRVLVHFMEERAFSRKERQSLRGGLKERLDRAAARIITKRPATMLVLDKLCGEYVEIKDKGLKPGMTDAEWNVSKAQPFIGFAEGEPRFQDEQKRIRQLEIEIEGIDTYLRISENGGADVVAAIVYLYYRTGLDSVGVGSELGLKPPHIRQTLWRLHQTAKKLQASGKFKELAAKPPSAKRGLITPPLF